MCHGDLIPVDVEGIERDLVDRLLIGHRIVPAHGELPGRNEDHRRPAVAGQLVVHFDNDCLSLCRKTWGYYH